MAYKSIHTSYGLQRMAQAQTTGRAINLLEMAIGDGNGNAVTPDRNQASLVRERFRGLINRVYVEDPVNAPRRYSAELVVPASVGGFTAREIAVIDADGGLFVVGNLPATYKPTPNEGVFADSVFRVVFEVTNDGVVNLHVDPNVVVVTQTWINNNVTPAYLLPGGTTGQFLAKASNADGEFRWADLSGVNVTVDCIEEPQTLVAGQTLVDLAQTNTRGLAVYIDGVRILRGVDWTPDPVNATRLTLARAYPAGTKFAAAQNDPTGNALTPLEQSKNLADVLDKPLARTNLGVYSMPEVDQRSKAPGEMGYTAASTPPPRCLKANGAAVSRVAYAALFAAIGTRYGAGDGFNTFNLPDGRGEFIRGFDDGRGIDTGRALGSVQSGQNASHIHDAKATWSDVAGTTGNFELYYDGEPSGREARRAWVTQRDGTTGHTHNISVQPSGGNEARPRNLALLCWIAY